MTINIDNAVDLIIERVRRRYPDFQSVHDAAFKVDETDNKRKASALAREKLSEDSLDELIAQAAWSDVISRVEEVAKATDLLYLTMPRKGDLGLLYHPDLDKAAFARAIRDLLFGEGDSPERLGRFVQWTEDEGLPSKWMLPSYLLFLCFPDTEIFVKPRVLTRFMRLMDPGFKHPRPGSAGYSAIRETAEFLKRALTDVGVADMIDVQSVMWVAGTAEDRSADIAMQTLAKPFDQIFDSYIDARHAFRRLREMFDALGISGPDDKRFTLSLPRKYKGKTLRFIFGPWLILDFVEGEEVLHTLKENGLGYKRLGESFAVKEGEPDFIFYELPLEDFLGEDEALEAVRQASLNLIAEKFSGWKATPYRSKNNPHLAEAVFSDEKLRTLLTSGLPAHAEVTRAPTALFSARSFELMTALAETPTRAFYDEHREDFRRFVEQPFRDLFRGVHGEMPEVIRDHMETQSRLFSRIVKNDWGRGGAWPHYWAAFYPKGGRRIEEAQLFAGITGEGFEFGFAIGGVWDDPPRDVQAKCLSSSSCVEARFGRRTVGR